MSVLRKSSGRTRNRGESTRSSTVGVGKGPATKTSKRGTTIRSAPPPKLGPTRRGKSTLGKDRGAATAIVVRNSGEIFPCRAKKIND